MDKEEEANNTAAANRLAEGDIHHTTHSGSNFEEEEKIEEDVIVDDRLAGTRSGSGKLKPPEDEHDNVTEDTSDVCEEKEQAAQQNNANQEKAEDVDLNAHGQEATPPQKRTVATIPDENTNTVVAQENLSVLTDSPVLNNGDDDRRVVQPDRRVVQPGVMFVPGPGYTGTGIHTGYVSDSGDDSVNEGGVIIQGFLPEDDPQETPRNISRAENAEERIQRLIDNAITLDDSAVKPIPIEEDGDEEGGIELEAAAQSKNSGNNGDEVAKSDNRRWFVPLLMLVIAACMILAIALPVSLRGKPDSAAPDMTASLSDAVCLPGGVDVRFELAKSILSSITSPNLLEDESTPQGKAIRWIVCDDSISVRLLGNQDLSTGNLPQQNRGFLVSGNSGEAQVTRRYILAVFSYSTSQVRPWTDSLNFLSPDLHECNWHKNYSRHNFPFGEWDPVGVICTVDTDDVTPMQGVYILLDDEGDYTIMSLELNFRMVNNLNGVLPPEIGYLLDCKSIMLENNILLAGQLPQKMGNMTNLKSVSLILNGPYFGGELPSSLFQLKNLTTIHIEGNLGKEWSLPANVQVGDDLQLERLVLKDSFVGTIPSWIVQLKHLQTLDLTMSKFQGAIPEAIGDLSSIKYLNMMGNNLTETIPSSLGKLSSIEVLILGNNALQGELPASIGNLRTLQLLDVGSNEMTSIIPSSFANLESLKYLVLEFNRFNGTVDVLESMKNLTVLLIRSNSFSGALPDGLFSEISEDVVVDVGDNKFTGELPANLANMSNLVSLIGAKNSFAASATQDAVCDNTTLLVMDCDACECCEVCCDGGNDAVCDFHLDVFTLLGYDCGAWFAACLRLQGADYLAGAGIY